MKRIVASTLAAALTLTAGSALAAANFRQSTSTTSTDDFGNSNFWAKYYFSTSQWNKQYSYSSDRTVQQSYALATLWGKAEVFGNLQTILSAQGGGYGFRIRTASTGANSYTDIAYGTVSVLGNRLYYVSGNNNCGSNRSCSSYNTSRSMTFFHADDTFVVVYVPVNVEATVRGRAYAGVAGEGYAAKYLGRNDSFYGAATGTLDAGVNVTAELDAFAGIEGVLGAGVTAEVKLVEASVTPTVRSKLVQSATSSRVTTVWENRMPLTISTLDGVVRVHADISPWWSPSTKILDWDGYAWTRNIVNNSGSRYYY
jgi:hypothetical protein